jgi:hypothetical protein
VEDILRPIYQQRASQEGTLGVLLIEKNKPFSPLTDNFDVVLFIIVEEADTAWSVKHYEFKEKKAALHIVTHDKLNEWLLFGSNRRVVEWIINGQVLFDRNEYLEILTNRLNEFPFNERMKKIGLEFSKLIRRITDGKELFHAGNHLDSFNHIVHALHHLARLSIIEHGYHPEVTVWSQVKAIEPEIYKLYKELISGEESLDKRIELLLIAIDFAIMSKTKLGANHFLSIIDEKEEWTFAEIMEESEFTGYNVDLGILLEFLVENNHVNTIRRETKSKSLYHRLYTTK